jgi:hypothetical protein
MCCSRSSWSIPAGSYARRPDPARGELASIGHPCPLQGFWKGCPLDIRWVDRWPAHAAGSNNLVIDVDLSLPDFRKLADMSAAPTGNDLVFDDRHVWRCWPALTACPNCSGSDADLLQPVMACPLVDHPPANFIPQQSPYLAGRVAPWDCTSSGCGYAWSTAAGSSARLPDPTRIEPGIDGRFRPLTIHRWTAGQRSQPARAARRQRTNNLL